MKIRIKFVSLGIFTVGLCACSFLGDRPESTRIDLDVSSIPQMKVLSKKGSTTDKKDDADVENKDLKKVASTELGYEFSIEHPTMDATDFIIKNSIDFDVVASDQVNNNNVFTEMDRGSMFGNLGVQFEGTLKKMEPTTQNLQTIATKLGIQPDELPYNDQTSNEIKGKIIQENQACDGNTETILASGDMHVNMSDVNLALLGLDEGQRKKILTNKNNLTTITPVAITDLDKKTQNKLYGAFDPKLNEIIIVAFASLEVCTPPNGKPIGWVITKDGNFQIPPNQIIVNENQIILTATRNVPNSELDNYKISSNGKSLKEITFKTTTEADEEVRVPVFTISNYKENLKYILPITNNPNNAKTQPVVKKDIKASSNTNQTSSDLTAPPANPPQELESKGLETPVAPQTQTILTRLNTPKNLILPTSTPRITGKKIPNPTYKKATLRFNTEPSKSIGGGHSKNEMTAMQPALLTKKLTSTNPSVVPDSLKRIPNTGTTPTVKQDPVKKNSAPSSIKKTYDIVKKFSKNTQIWFNANVAGLARQFYKKNDDDEFEYKPVNGLWNNSLYSSKQWTDGEVNTVCSSYEYSRNMKLSVKAQPPSWAGPLSNGGIYKGEVPYIKNPDKTYYDVLFDQFSIQTADVNFLVRSKVTNGLVLGAMNISDKMKNQDWDLKICFDSKKGFTGFLSSNETSTNFKTNTIRPDHWVKISTDRDNNNQPLLATNRSRITSDPSSFSINCKNNPEDCLGRFQLSIKRNFNGQLMLAYMNPKLFPGIARGEMTESIRKTDFNRNEIVIYGGFKFNPETKGPATADYISPTDLNLIYNAIPVDEPFKPNVVAQILFPGDTSELFFNVVKR